MSTKITYSKWRHGGWYVEDARYPNGAIGCVSNNFADKKWRIVDETNYGSFIEGVRTFRTRDEAARAEILKCERMTKAWVEFIGPSGIERWDTRGEEWARFRADFREVA